MSDTSSKAAAMSRTEMFGHPVGLFILFLTEMWERFSYYGMRAILVLYLTAKIADTSQGGMGWDNGDALVLYGWYTMMVYVMSIPGGILADRFIGAKKAVLVGGLLLCAGHGILAVDAEWAFFSGLALIVLGVGALKPNISTMVGGLYPPGDVRRDKGFTIFYIGINIGALAASLLVAWVAAEFGWHAGFGLAGIGMLLGQAVYMMGQKHLVGVGDYVPPKKEEGSDKETPLTPIEKDRIKVMLIAFLIIIVFWGAFEQAGGLLNIYAQDKIDRMLLGWEVPAGMFQGVNSFFIITLGTVVAAFWANRALRRKESSTLFKMALGTIIMGLGFLMMAVASREAGPTGKASMVWLILAYLLHTVGELCASPTALSFVTKLAPMKYASLMMGAYFAATGFGNKLAGSIGEASQSEPIEIVAQVDQLKRSAIKDSLSQGGEQYIFDINTAKRGDAYVLELPQSNFNFTDQVTLKGAESKEKLMQAYEDHQDEGTPVLTGYIKFDKVADADTPTYNGTMVIDHVQSEQEFNTFVSITILTAVFGLLLLAFLKRLKKLTHGAEDVAEDAP